MAHERRPHAKATKKTTMRHGWTAVSISREMWTRVGNEDSLICIYSAHSGVGVANRRSAAYSSTANRLRTTRATNIDRSASPREGADGDWGIACIVNNDEYDDKNWSSDLRCVIGRGQYKSPRFHCGSDGVVNWASGASTQAYIQPTVETKILQQQKRVSLLDTNERPERNRLTSAPH